MQNEKNKVGPKKDSRKRKKIKFVKKRPLVGPLNY